MPRESLDAPRICSKRVLVKRLWANWRMKYRVQK